MANTKIVTCSELNDMCNRGKPVLYDKSIIPFSGNLNKCPTKSEIEETRHFGFHMPTKFLSNQLVPNTELQYYSVLYFPKLKGTSTNNIWFIRQGSYYLPYNSDHGAGHLFSTWNNLWTNIGKDTDHPNFTSATADLDAVPWDNVNHKNPLGQKFYKVYGANFGMLSVGHDVIVDDQPVTMTTKIVMTRPVGSAPVVLQSIFKGNVYRNKIIVMQSEVPYDSIEASWNNVWRQRHEVDYNNTLFGFGPYPQTYTKSDTKTYQTNIFEEAKSKYLIVSNPFTTYDRDSLGGNKLPISYACNSITYNGVTKPVKMTDAYVQFELNSSNNHPLLNREVVLSCAPVFLEKEYSVTFSLLDNGGELGFDDPSLYPGPWTWKDPWEICDGDPTRLEQEVSIIIRLNNGAEIALQCALDVSGFHEYESTKTIKVKESDFNKLKITQVELQFLNETVFNKETPLVEVNIYTNNDNSVYEVPGYSHRIPKNENERTNAYWESDTILGYGTMGEYLNIDISNKSNILLSNLYFIEKW